MADVRAQALSFVSELLTASEKLAGSSPLLDDDLLERLRPLFTGREPTGAEVRSAVLASLSRFGFHPLCHSAGVAWMTPHGGAPDHG